MVTIAPNAVAVRRDADVSVTVVGEQHHVSTTLVQPATGGASDTLLVTVPGGTYDRSYWDLHVPGAEDYSFADYAAARGQSVLLLDNLGTGRSSRPSDACAVNLSVMADALSQAVRSVAGGLAEESGSGSSLRLVGVGHSMGGAITASAQAAHKPFAQVALLGTSFIGYGKLRGFTTREQQSELLRSAAGDSWDDGYVTVPRAITREMFHAADVPDAVIEAEKAGETCEPREAAIDSAFTDAIAHIPPRIDVPVFLAFAENDISPNPHSEIAFFSAAPDVTVYRLPGSAHCHNAATTRRLLWDRLLRWVTD